MPHICLIEINTENIPRSLTHPVIAIAAEQARNCRENLQKMGVEILDGGNMAHFKFLDLDGNLLEAFLPSLYEDPQYEDLR